jgi:hypothetical protein
MYYIYANLLIFVIKYAISLAERSNVVQKNKHNPAEKDLISRQRIYLIRYKKIPLPLFFYRKEVLLISDSCITEHLFTKKCYLS